VPMIHGLSFNNLRGDVRRSVAAVALPLALAFGVASGAGAVPASMGYLRRALRGVVRRYSSQVSVPRPVTVVMAGSSPIWAEPSLHSRPSY
jgi:SulP family sulfate permease